MLYSFYMDEHLKKLIQENNNLIHEHQLLIHETLDIAKKNEKKITAIHTYIRRMFIAKIMYWVIIVLVAAGAFYTIRPRVETLIERYNTFQAQLDVTSHAISNDPKSLIEGIVPKKDDIGILNRLFH